MPQQIERKLTTILAADAQGYSSRMEQDEVGTLAALRHARSVFRRFIERHNGRIANTAGDGLLVDFPSVVEAVRCAIEVQQELRGGPLPFRIGIHLGDVMIDGDDLLGEGVNLAARLQTMAEPGGILISQQVYDQVESKLSVGFEYLGERRPKNYSGDVPIYKVASGTSGKSTRTQPAPRRANRVRVDDRTDAVSEAAVTPDTRLRKRAKTIGVLVGFLFAVDVFTGGETWSHYPAIIAVTVLGLQAAPHLTWPPVSTLVKRVLVLLGGLTLLNLASWENTLWVIWPAVVVGAVLALRWVQRAG